ncbi:MAG: 23S rRNA (uracil(1939)-C(5))-methyltransferase RlmD [Christensenellales bacterium]|jgi:23S rRNA (uracil1939-C5)-methyltransferase
METPIPQSGLRKNQEVSCRIDALGAQGEGICRGLGQVLFVPGALPGEEIRVRVQKVTKSLAYGKLLEVLKASLDRTAPPCPHFGCCGGCAMQHMSYQAQLTAKGQQVQDCLRRIGKLSIQVSASIGMEHPWRYRNKTALPVQLINGKPHAGFYAPRSHRLIPITECLIARPACDAATAAVIRWMREYAVIPYQEESKQGLVRHIISRVNTRDEVMVTLAINGGAIPHADALIQGLKSALPGFHSLHLTHQMAGDNVILGEDSHRLYGDRPFIDEACGLRFELSPLAFFQVNSTISQRMYQDAITLAGIRPGDTVVDLYSGAGVITLLASGHCHQAIGIEIAPQAVANAKANAVLNGINNAAFYEGAAEALLPRMQAEGLRCDVAFLDPPRKGAHPEVLSAIAQACPRRIIYISCHPASQARDAALLEEMGYQVVSSQPYDMFCQTAEVENLLCFDRIEGGQAHGNSP